MLNLIRILMAAFIVLTGMGILNEGTERVTLYSINVFYGGFMVLSIIATVLMFLLVFMEKKDTSLLAICKKETVPTKWNVFKRWVYRIITMSTIGVLIYFDHIKTASVVTLTFFVGIVTSLILMSLMSQYVKQHDPVESK